MSTADLDERLRSQVEALLKSARAFGRAPAISVQASWRGFVFGAADGPATELADGDQPLGVHTRFRLSCIASVISAIIALMLAQRRELDLDSPLGRYLPDLRGTENGDQVKIWHLMCHTTGYAGPPDDARLMECATRLDALLEQVALAPRLFAAGAWLNYEVSNYWLLNRILAAVTGTHPAELFASMIARPLGIAHDGGTPSSWSDDQREPIPWGLDGLRLSPAELVSICQALTAAAEPASRAIFGKLSESLFSTRMRLPGFLGIDPYHQAGFGFSLGCAEFSGGFYGQNGSTGRQCAGIRIHPRENLALAVFVDALEPVLRDEIIRRIVAALVPTPARPEVPAAIRFDDPMPYIGDFVGSRMRVSMAMHHDELICEVFDAGRSQGTLEVFYKADDGGWYVTPKAARSPLRFCAIPGTGQRAIMIGAAALLKS